MREKRIGIIGASGYVGHELLRTLKGHPQVKLEVLNSRTYGGKKISSLYKDFTGSEVYTDLSYGDISRLGLDLIFLALPHTLSMNMAKKLDSTARIIDLSADFRFKNPELYQEVYGQKLDTTDKQWIYGLPELFREKIISAGRVANPGCYATCCLLAAYPLQDQAEQIIFDCKSGYSGAGRSSIYSRDPSTIKDNLIAYNLTRHRHKYEIQQFMDTSVSFTPHVFNTFRGMMSTVHILLKRQTDPAKLYRLYKDFYKSSPFVRVTREIPNISDIQNTNFCDIGGFEIDENNRLAIVAVIDNLGKGAAHQAVQNMNLMLGFDETEGLL